MLDLDRIAKIPAATPYDVCAGFVHMLATDRDELVRLATIGANFERVGTTIRQQPWSESRARSAAQCPHVTEIHRAGNGHVTAWLTTQSLRCALPRGHAGGHMAATGYEWAA